MAKKSRQKDNFLLHIFIITIAFLLVRLISSQFVSSRLWGLNQAGYVEYLAIIYPILMAIACIIYYYSRTRTASFSVNIPRPAIYALYLAGFALLLYFLSTAAHFLGDGYQLISNLANPNLVFKSESYGEMLIHRQAALWLGAGDKNDVYLGFKFISIISGVMFATTLLFYGKKIFGLTFKYFIFVAINTLGAITILYYGYVETYSIVTVCLYWYLLSALASLVGKKRSLTPIIALAAAFFFHKISIIFLPTLIVYIWYLFGGDISGFYRRYRKIVVWILIATPLISSFVIYLAAPLAIRFIFLAPFGDQFTTDNYFLFSTKHLIDYLNLLLLVSPVLLLSIILQAMSKFAGVKYVVAGDSSGATDFFLIVSLITSLAAAFLIAPKLGMARDWDLMAVMLVGAVIFGNFRFIQISGEHRKFRPAAMLVIILSLSILIPWVAVHNSVKSLSIYAVQIMKLEPKHSRTGLQVLTSIMKSRGNNRDAQMLQNYCDMMFPEMDMHRQGERFLIDHDYRRAEAALKRTITENPSFFRSYATLARIYLETGQFDKALVNLKIADAMNPYNSDVAYYSGLIYQYKNDDDKLRASMARSIQYDQLNPLPYMALSKHYYENRNPDSSRYYLNLLPDTIDIFPIEANLELAQIALRLNDTGKTIFYANKYLEAETDSSQIDKYPILKEFLGRYGEINHK